VLRRAPQAVALLQGIQGVLSVQALPPGYRPGQSAPVAPVPQAVPVGQPPMPVYAPPNGSQAGGAIPPPPVPVGGGQPLAVGTAPATPATTQVGEAATLHLRVAGDDTFLNFLLTHLVKNDIAVFGFEEAMGDIEDIFMRTTRGLVQ
jgi:hypothetical protein